jgi:hypothetical protein
MSVRDHLESAIRQMKALGKEPRLPIDIGEAERAELAEQEAKRGPATKEDVDLLLRRIRELEAKAEARSREVIFVNAISGERIGRGVRRIA